MKTPLVLLHGWGMNSQIWHPIRQELAGSFELHLLDLPGYGNDRPYAEGYELERVTERVLSAAPQQAFWIAWSLGATIAMQAARLVPNRFLGLQLISPTPRFMTGAGWRFGMETAPLLRLVNEFESDYEKGLKKFLLLQLNQQPGARKHLRQCLDALEQFPPPNMETLRSSLQLLTETDLRNDVRQICVPTQVIAGSDDQVIPATASRWLSEGIPTATFEQLASGHMPFLSAKDQYLGCLTAFTEACAA